MNIRERLNTRLDELNGNAKVGGHSQSKLRHPLLDIQDAAAPYLEELRMLQKEPGAKFTMEASLTETKSETDVPVFQILLTKNSVLDRGEKDNLLRLAFLSSGFFKIYRGHEWHQPLYKGDTSRIEPEENPQGRNLFAHLYEGNGAYESTPPLLVDRVKMAKAFEKLAEAIADLGFFERPQRKDGISQPHVEPI